MLFLCTGYSSTSAIDCYTRYRSYDFDDKSKYRYPCRASPIRVNACTDGAFPRLFPKTVPSGNDRCPCLAEVRVPINAISLQQEKQSLFVLKLSH